MCVSYVDVTSLTKRIQLTSFFLFFHPQDRLRQFCGYSYETSSVGFHCLCLFFCRSCQTIRAVWGCQNHWKLLLSTPTLYTDTLHTQISTKNTLVALKFNKHSHSMSRDKVTVNKYRTISWVESQSLNFFTARTAGGYTPHLGAVHGLRVKKKILFHPGLSLYV